MKRKKDKRTIIYVCQALFRIALIFLPQTGYIHPDEFFQSIEVLAGKILDVQSSPPWEFNVTTPIRSMTIPYLTIGISYNFLRDFNYFSKEYLNQALLTPYLLLVIPRLIICLCSFAVDYCLYKLCLNNNEKFKSRLLILASSYVMIVYGTRTFSNTFEMILFSLLLYFVCESLTFNNILLKRKEYVNFRYDKSKTTVDKAKFHKLRLYLASDSYRSCFTISTITVFGFFNRPTFIAFSVIPIFFWLYRGVGSKSVSPVAFYMRLLIFAIYSIPSFIFNILVDSFYYGHLTWGEIGVLDVTLKNFVFTPLNFIRYNFNFKNLAIHGLHPRFLHILVNIPLLFNVLGICAICAVGKYLYLCCLRKFNLLPSVRSIKCLMTLSFVVPLLTLSFFPHQEPRFLLPLILPLVYLHATTILPEVDQTVVEASKTTLVTQTKKKSHNDRLLRVWLSCNTVLVLLYGFVHQGGVYKATEYLSEQMAIVPVNTEYHIVTSHIYSLPESLFLQKSHYQLYLKGKVDRVISRRVFLYEEGSRDITFVLKKIKLIINLSKANSKHFKLYLLISGTLEDILEYSAKKANLKIYLLKKFNFHISFEALPNLYMYCWDLAQPYYRDTCIPLTFDEYVNWVASFFNLHLYRIELKG